MRNLERGLTFLFLFFTFTGFAQHIQWNTAPETGFVFQISNSEAQRLLTRSKPDTIFHGLLHTQIDTFNVNRGWLDRPAKGHFILARVVENSLVCEYTSVFPYQVYLLKEYNVLSLQVLDLEGNVREDAKVKLKNRRLRLDPESRTYRIENEWFGGQNRIVTVELDGFRSVFNVEKHEVPSWDNNYYDEDEGPDFYSYMITDKNKYKPGERVRFKSYALSHSRTPLRRDLELWITSSAKSTKLSLIGPHRPGSFAGEFHLHDSLKLTLDQHYTLQLRERNGHIVANCTFKYEDYELHRNTLQVQLKSGQQFHPVSNEVVIHATDVNGLTLKDARATIRVSTESIREIFQPLVSLPDTLLFKTIDLDPDSATVVSIPSSLFQKSNTIYHVDVAVVNSENHRMEQRLTAMHYYSQYELATRFSNDSIIYDVLNNGIPMKDVPMKLYRNDDVAGTSVVLPFREKINPALWRIRLTGDLVSRTIHLRDLLPEIDLAGGIQKDSFNITMHNPQKLEVSWYVYQGSQLLEKGFGTEFTHTSFISDRTQTYYAELLYSFGGEDQLKRKAFEFRESSLDVSLDLPDRVYPGQKVEALIQVTNEAGDPVGGVDITALATTAKLNYYLPDLPYYGSSSSPRSERANYSKSKIDKRIATLPLPYKKWEKRAGLDTMKYYQFTYPYGEPFVHMESIDDSTQFAPYVMQNGQAKRIHVIEIDRMPVYYSWVDHPRGYSFYVQPNRRKEVTLRLHDRVLILDSLVFEKGKKTIISIDLDHLPKSVKTHRLAPNVETHSRRRKTIFWAFTPQEVYRHTVYVAAFRRTDRTAYLASGKEFTPLFKPWSHTRDRVIAGPVTPGTQTYQDDGHTRITYRHAGGHTYEFEHNVVYKLEAKDLLPARLFDIAFKPMPQVNDVVINKKLFLESRVEEKEKWHPAVIDLVDHATHAKFLLPLEPEKTGVASILFQHCTTGNMVSPCQHSSGRSDFYTIPRGCYHAIVLYNSGAYLKMDGVGFRSHVHIVADMNTADRHPADSLSRSWLATLSNACYRPVSTRPSTTYSFNDFGRRNGNVRGVLYDDTNMPLPGVTIVEKGTVNGTVTDVDGKFSLDIHDENATLVVSFIGYTTKEIEVRPGSELAVMMEPDVQYLEEVVVTAYGQATTRRSLSASFSRLSGKVAGVSISKTDEEDPSGEESRENEAVVREAEKRLYQELLTLKSIRSNFSDVGFWEPKLFTDRHGQSKFTVTFPDDITRWDAVVYAMNRQLQTGIKRKSIRSYKPLMAELHVPRFLTAGDSANFTGKVLNYTGDKDIRGKVTWDDARSRIEKEITFASHYTEKLPVYAAGDSLTTRYHFTRDDGYFDGEARSLPVMPQGVVRANGTLSILKNKDEVHLKAGEQEKVHVEILDNQLDLYSGDARYLLDYKYACNEQLASKLIGLIQHKHLLQYEGKSFRLDKDVNKIIQRLLKNQNEEFLWSWWDVSPATSYWISAHILRALKTAKDAGYAVPLDLNNVSRKAAYKFDLLQTYTTADADMLHALAMWGADLDYRKYIQKIDTLILTTEASWRTTGRRGFAYSLLKEKFLLLEARQIRNLPFVRDSLLRYRKEDILGGIHFTDGKPAYGWYSDDLASNIIAYRILRHDPALRDMLAPLQLYFLSQRRQGGWNTYQAANVLMSILPDLLAEGVSKDRQAAVGLRGKVNESITKFPFRTTLTAGEELHMTKESGLPLYYMQYKEERVTTAKTGGKGFRISTSFSEKVLKAGKPGVLKVEVEVEKDAAFEYVMIEVPIPGACSYADKRQHDSYVETHREYFKDRTVIFCEKMKSGKYAFQVQLLPRFTGKYVVNPAEVLLMYVPVINANTEMKKVSVAE